MPRRVVPIVKATGSIIGPVTDVFTCAYCDDPAATPSVAHIFPDALGGVTAPDTTVCRSCNSIVNSRVENPAIRRFAFFRSGMGLRGRRGDLPKVPAFLESMGQQLAIMVGQGGELPPHGIVREIKTEEGAGIVVMGEGRWVEERKQELSSERPASKWRELAVPEEFTVAFENEPDCLEWRRLAAKIAYERFAQLRGSSVVKERGFDTIRRFILEGPETQPVAGLIDDADWIEEGGGLWVGVPRHAVAIAVTPRAGSMYAVNAAVCLFGLYHFWVRLSASFFTLAPFDDIVIEHPQTRTVENPSLRYRVGVPRLPMDGWTVRSARHPEQVREATKRYAYKKFHAALDGSSEPE